MAEGTLPSVLYGTVPNHADIGYIWIPSFNSPIEDEQLETISASFKDTKGLILDVRLNGCGDPALATKVASYFTDKPVDIGYERFKTGRWAHNFTNCYITLQPIVSTNKYLKRYCSN